MFDPRSERDGCSPVPFGRAEAGPFAKTVSKSGTPQKAPTDRFFKPFALQPDGLPLDIVKLLTKREALKRSNYFMFDEDETMPFLVLRIGSICRRLFAPQQPIWRMFIVIRRLQKILGINALRRVFFEIQHGSKLASFKT